MSGARDVPEPGRSWTPTGSIPPRTLSGDPHLVMLCRPNSPPAERYRRLRLSLERESPDGTVPRQLTVITSPIPGEGKTITAVNLALAFAEVRRHRTLLIEGDLRRPSAPSHVRPTPALGLTDVLTGAARLDHALIETSPTNLWVLPSGPPAGSPLELLRGGRFAALVVELRRRFDRILIDSPPTLPFADAAVLASHADGTILVVRAGTTTKPLIRRAMDSLAGARLLGAVLNDVVFTAVDRYYGHDDDYGPERHAHARSGARAR